MSREQLRKTLAEVPTRPQRLTVDDFTLSANSQGTKSKIAEYQAERPFAIRQGDATDLHITATETFTTDGTGSNTETFSLTHDVVDSAAVADDLVLFKDDGGYSRVQPDSVDYSNDSFDFTDSGTDNDLRVFYIAGTQALAQWRAVAPKDVNRQVQDFDAGLANLREQTRDPLSFTFEKFEQAVVPTDWTLELHLNAPYTFKYSDGDAEAVNMLLDVPISKATTEVPNLGRMLKETV